MRGAVLCLAVACLLGVATPSYGARKTVAPPGNSAIDEYQETVPGASGNSPSGGGPSGTAPGAVPGVSGNGAPAPARVVPSTVTRALRRDGKDGAAVATLAQGTAPQTAGSKASQPERTVGKGFLSTILSAAGTGGSGEGMGALLPLLLVLTVAGGAAVVVAARRR